MIFLRLIGVIFVVIGLLGLLLPVIPGIVFLIFGPYFITFGNPAATERIRKFLGHTPKLLALFDKFDARMRHWFKIDAPSEKPHSP